MTNGRTDETPATVPDRAKRAGETQDRWSWVEPSVWTERMLAALDRGVKGGRWYSLMDKVSSRRNLQAAFRKVKANGGSAGVDHQTIKMFEQRLDENLDQLERDLVERAYRPRPIKRVWIPKAGSRKEKRPLGIPTVRDRVAQAALRNVLEPIFERDFAEQSYGFRPRRGTKDALRRVDELLKEGCQWVVDADLKDYFGTIDHERLLDLLRQKVTDQKALDLIESFLGQKVLDGMEGWVPEGGTPQGAVISPLFANVYLDPLDHEMERSGYEMVRYADDFVVLCRSESEAREALVRIERWTAAVGLAVHPEKTHVVDVSTSGGFDFLGYHFERGHRWPSKKSLRKLKDKLRGKTKRTSGHSFEALVTDVNRTLKGWFEYFKHSAKSAFPAIDSWVRLRLRSTLRRRNHGRGRARGRDHQRWPNAYFAEHGLFSLVTARAEACQSAVR